MTLDQVKHARPTSDYDGLYGGSRDWTADRFVEAVYRSVAGGAMTSAPLIGRAARAGVVPLAALASTVGLAPAGAQQNAPRAASARAGAFIDITGQWVSVVTEDWRWRMVTPPKGDTASVPLNPAGRKVADAWDLAADRARGDLCKAFGPPGAGPPARTHPDPLGGRQHAAARVRRRHADAPVPLRRRGRRPPGRCRAIRRRSGSGSRRAAGSSAAAPPLPAARSRP